MTEPLLTARALGELLGFAAATIVDWAERGEVPAFKIGGRLRFRESEVLDWLEARRVNGPSVAEEGAPVPYQPPDPRRSIAAAPVPITGGTDAS